MFWYVLSLVGVTLVLSVVLELVDRIRQYKEEAGYVTLSDRRAKLQKLVPPKKESLGDPTCSIGGQADHAVGRRGG